MGAGVIFVAWLLFDAIFSEFGQWMGTGVMCVASLLCSDLGLHSSELFEMGQQALNAFRPERQQTPTFHTGGDRQRASPIWRRNANNLGLE